LSRKESESNPTRKKKNNNGRRHRPESSCPPNQEGGRPYGNERPRETDIAEAKGKNTTHRAGTGDGKQGTNAVAFA